MKSSFIYNLKSAAKSYLYLSNLSLQCFKVDSLIDKKCKYKYKIRYVHCTYIDIFDKKYSKAHTHTFLNKSLDSGMALLSCKSSQIFVRVNEPPTPQRGMTPTPSPDRGSVRDRAEKRLEKCGK